MASASTSSAAAACSATWSRPSWSPRSATSVQASSRSSGTPPSRSSIREAARAYLGCADRFGSAQLNGLEGLDAFNEAAETIVDSADRAALPLFAGIAAEPLPDDPAARAYRNICNLRELRGSVHLLAIVATGVSPVTAHTIRRPNDVASFGWESPPEITDADRAALDTADELTDRLLVPAIEALTDDQRAAYIAGVEAIGARLT